MMLFTWKNTLKIVFIAQLVITCFSKGFSQEIIHRNYDALQGLTARSIHEYDNSDIIISGSVRFFSGNNILLNPMVMRTDSLGIVKWAKSYIMPRSDSFFKSVLLSDHSMVAIGSTESYGPVGTNGTQFDTTRKNILIARIDSSGNPVNVLVYGDTLQDSGMDILLSESGDLIFLGMSNYDHSLDFKIGNMLLARIDTSLNIFISKEFYFGAGIKVSPNRIVESNGYFYVSGIISYFDSVSNWSDAFLMKLDQNFNILWANRMGSDKNEFKTGLVENASGVFIGFATFDYGTDPLYTDFVVALVDSAGVPLWSNRYGNFLFGDDRVDHLMFDIDSTEIIISSGNRNHYIDLGGNYLRSVVLSTVSTCSISSGVSKNDGGNVMICFNQSTSNTSMDLVISDSSGTTCTGYNFVFPFVPVTLNPVQLTVNSVVNFLAQQNISITSSQLVYVLSSVCQSSTGIDLPEGYESYPTVFPNPASDFIGVKISGREAELDILEILNGFGRSVRPEISSAVSSNRIDISNLDSGIYLLKIMYNNFIYYRWFVKL
jgi:hypothetical protein